MALNEDGESWIWTGLSWATVGAGGHDELTLSVPTELFMGLTGQELTLDAQGANLIFSGPAAGGADDPTFRSLVDADIPAAIARDSELHSALTLSGTPDYITLSGQNIVRGLIVLTTDVTGLLPAANIDPAIARDSELHTSFLSADADTLIATHAAIGGSHHVAFVEADADALIATHAALEKPTCQIYGPTQATTSGVNTVMTMDTTVIDNDSMADLDNDQIVIKTAGVYMLQGNLDFAHNTTGARGGSIWSPTLGYLASYFGAPTPTSPYGTTLVVFAIVELAVDNAIKLRRTQVSGGALNVSGGVAINKSLAATLLFET